MFPSSLVSTVMASRCYHETERQTRITTKISKTRKYLEKGLRGLVVVGSKRNGQSMARGPTKKYQRKRQKNNKSHKIFCFPPFFFHKNFHKNKYLKNRVWRYYVLKTQLIARNWIVSSVHETEQTWGSPTHPLSWEEWGSKVKREQTWQAGCAGDVATLATLACAH